MEKFIWKNEKKGVLGMFLIVLVVIIAYLYLYNNQREIDKNLGITQGEIISYKLSTAQSGMCIEYKYIVNGKIYIEYAYPHKSVKDWIDYSNNYTIEYSSENPKNSRIIVNGIRYSRGVD